MAIKKKKNTTNKKLKPYSEIRRKLNIEVDRNTDSGLAHLTHYFQNHENGVSQFFRPHAKEYLVEQHEKLSIVEEPDFQYYLPVKWDIPFPPPEKSKFKFIDLFAGIGGIRLAYQNLGGKCVFTSEWDTYSKKTYEANFGEVPFGDITKIKEENIPDHDILLAGFPCQPFSIAGVSKKNALGKKHGFLDETQGTLFFDVARIIKHKRPKAFMLENVKNLVSHDKGKTFRVITETLKELNYSIHYKVLDGKYFVPQHRERIIIVGFNNDVFKGMEDFKFPTLTDTKFKIKDILEHTPNSKYTLTDHLWEYLQNYAKKHKEKGNGFGFGLTDLNGISRTMSARYYKDGAEILIPQKGKNPRRLTPRESARLQGFPDSFKIPVSDTQAYRQFGNSVVMPLMQAVGENVVKELVKQLNGKARHKLNEELSLLKH
jgi:DNA (cytosine-5)-methyltransferase 1